MRQNPLLLTAGGGVCAVGDARAAKGRDPDGSALETNWRRRCFRAYRRCDVQRVTEEITRLGEIPSQQLTQVLTEFYGLLETQQYMVRGGPEYALQACSPRPLGQPGQKSYLAQVKKIRERSNGDMADAAEDGSAASEQVSRERASADDGAGAGAPGCEARLDGADEVAGAMRVDVVRRLAEMRQFSPEMAQTVALVLHKRMEGMGSSGRKSYSGFKAVAELLNRLDQTESQGILEEIEQSEPKLAIGIRNLMFTFEDLVTVPAESIREFVLRRTRKCSRWR